MSDTNQKLLAIIDSPSTVEIMINGAKSIFLEKDNGEVENPEFKFDSQESILDFLKTYVGTEAESIGPERPYADLVAGDGSRVHVVLSPIARECAYVTIRKRPKNQKNIEDLVKNETLSRKAAAFLVFALENRQNIMIVGGTSSGKTTLLNSLAAYLPDDARTVVIEDVPEIDIDSERAVYLTTRLRDSHGLADVTLRDLVANTLRMRPDRIVVGEIRGPEAMDLLQAMNVGHEGILSSLHANSPKEALSRLETLAMMSAISIPQKVVRIQIAQALNLVVYMSRLADGSRKVIQISEVTGMETDIITMQDLFSVLSKKLEDSWKRELQPTGAVPRFYDKLRHTTENLPFEFFQRDTEQKNS
ncbi:CpaF family protein [Elusimicrobiota bacterium]